MFNGVPEQFHQFIPSRTTTPLLPNHLTLPFNVSSPTFFNNFIDPQQLSNHHHHNQIFQSHLFNQLHQQSHNQDEEKEEEKEEERRVVVVDNCRNLELNDHQGVRSVSEIMVDPWEKEEVLALLRIRSSMGYGFSDFIWVHVSRKLAELGFKRSAETCKEKFEEMNQYCNDENINYSSRKNYNKSFSELEALFEDQNPKTTLIDDINDDESKNMVISSSGDQGKMGLNLEENSGNETLENPFVENHQRMLKKKNTSRKRKRHHKNELLKGLCEEIVNKIMIQQEELHKKLLQDMERKEEERVSREEDWKKEEFDRVNKEIEIRAKEQAIACDRETTIIEFLKKCTSSISSSQNYLDLTSVKTTEDITKTSSHNPSSNPLSSSPSIYLSSQNPNSFSKVVIPTKNNPKVPTSSSIATRTNRKPSSSCTTTGTQNNAKIPNFSHLDLACQNPNSLTTTQNNQADVTSSSTATTTAFVVDPSSTFNNAREENGKRWPRDEVYSLINLRCNLGNSNGVQDKENNKFPLWERISQGMLELGYKRSAKKCKEKWENINKYFRKTKDTNKKRSLDSKTCPYFHQLNSLYNQGRVLLPYEGQENRSAGLTENHLESPETTTCVSGGF